MDTKNHYGNFAEMSVYDVTRWARKALSLPQLRIIDTETTGHGHGWDNEADEIAEICILDREGIPLLNTLVRPAGQMHPDAAAKSGITSEMIAKAPSFSTLAQEIIEQLRDKAVVIYNADYDIPLLRSSVEDCGLSFPACDIRCAMLAYAAYRHVPDRRKRGYKWHRLDDACAYEGISIEPAHRALGDCRATLALLHCMARA